MVMVLDQTADFSGNLLAFRVLPHCALDLRMRNGFVGLGPLQKGRQVQAERIEEPVAVAAVHALLHIKGNLLRKINQRSIDDFQQPLTRRHIDRMLLVIQILDIDIDIRGDDLLDQIIADPLALEQCHLVLNHLIQVEAVLAAGRIILHLKRAARRRYDQRLADILRELRQGLPVRRQGQQPVLDVRRQHLKIHFNVVRIVDAIEKRLRAEQLDVRFQLADIAAADAADQRFDRLHADADRLFDALRLIHEQQLQDIELFLQRAFRQRTDRDDVRNAPHEGLGQR